MALSPQDQQIEDFIRQNYGYAAWALDNPELRPVLEQAAREQWDQARLQGAIEATNWWKQTSSSKRQWTELQATDPATAQARFDQAKASIKNLAGTMGLPLSDDRLNQIATDSVSLGWDSTQLRSALVDEIHWGGNGGMTVGTAAGDIGSTIAKLRQAASDYMVRVSDGTLQQYSTQIEAGSMNLDNFNEYVKQLARGKFPSLAGTIDQGITPSQYFAPMREEVARTLDTTPYQIDLTDDPKWSALMSFKDPATGTVRAMTISEAAKYARMQPEWQTTKDANFQAQQTGDAILRSFGKVA